MARLRALLGVLCGVILVGSAGAHSLLGWPALRTQLERGGAAPDLVTGLSIGWHFAGLAILLFGILALWQFGVALRGRVVWLRPLVLVGVAYAAFGVWALVAARMNPFFLMVFVVPGILLAIAAWEGRPGTTSRPIDA